jgi:hypothetical protein
MRRMAQLVGFAASQKAHPGSTVSWIGLQFLSDISESWPVFHGETELCVWLSLSGEGQD